MYNGNNEITSVYLGSEEITKIYQGSTVVYQKGDIDYSKMPLTFEITNVDVVIPEILWKKNGAASFSEKTIEYSKDNGATWTEITSSAGGTSIPVAKGDIIQFRGDNTQYATNNVNYTNFANSTIFGGNCRFKVYGNIMSLVDSTGYTTATTLPDISVFTGLFRRNTRLTDASNLVLPAIFLTDYCYKQMFDGCTSLVTAPELPATTLAPFCYANMFYDCRKLNYIKCLATDKSATDCTAIWASGVASTGTFVTPSTTNWTTGTSGIPSGWTRVNSD